VKKILNWISTFILQHNECIRIQRELIVSQKETIDALKQDLEDLQRIPVYSPVKVPRGAETLKAYDAWLSQLGDHDFFAFFIANEENKAIAKFAAGGNADEQRGMMKAFQGIRREIKQAALECAQGARNAEV